jgi:DDE superfamily endonuclease
MQGLCHFRVISKGIHVDYTNGSISISPNGWTDQELGSAWLRNDFDPATRDKAAGQYRLLILDGHNSHCTFTFCKYAADKKIIIICLPSHTTHALQPCDVGAFGPLAQSWKREVTLAAQSLIAIRKDNLLVHYHTARVEALKPTTIQSAFRKTGIWPLNPDAIPFSAFEPSKHTTTQAAQPLPAHLPSILVPTPTQTPTPSAATAATLHRDAGILGEELEESPSDDDIDEEPMERYHIEVPPPLPGTSSRQALRAENLMLRDIIVQAGIALEEDYAQMKLMDLENERLRKQAFRKAKQKNQNRLTSGHARHMTAAESLDLLARQDWERRMKDVFKEAAPQFKVQKKNITDHLKAIEKARKVAEQAAKKAAAAAARAERARGRGTRGGRRGGARGARGRSAAAPSAAVAEGSGAGTGTLAGDSDSEPSGATESSESDSDSDSDSEVEIPVPRSRRQCQIRVI